MVNWQNGAESFIDAVSSGSATPGGGAVGAFAAANGCALAMMSVSRLTMSPVRLASSVVSSPV